MKNYWKIMLMAVVAMAATACGEDDPVNPTPPTPDTPVMVELSLAAEDMPKVRAMDDDVIKNVNVYLYGKTNYNFYFPTGASALAFEALPGDYQMYVITNVHEDMGALTKTELEAYVVAYETMVDDIPMTAKIDVKIGSSSGTFALPEIQVKRNAAKIGYAIEVSNAVAANIKLQSVQFCNIPKSTSLFGTAAASTNKNDYYDSAVIDITDPNSFADVFYMFENCQGTVPSITDQKDKSPANAPACASYMKIYAQGVGKVIEYTVYLGENNTSDFNVRKNTKHKMDLVINGENLIDNRVKVYEGLYYGEANSYICTGTEITFDAKPYRTSKNQSLIYSGVYAGIEYEAKAAHLLWQDRKNLVKSINFKNNSVTVSTSGDKGNAVIAIFDKDNELLWSFHIWCTDQPIIYEFEKNKYDRSYSVMDRSLGATTASLGLVSSNGLHYQWGRKDPFIGSNSLASDIDGTMFDISGNTIAFQISTVQPQSIEAVVKTPQIFYCQSTNYEENWFHYDPSNRFLWGNLTTWKKESDLLLPLEVVKTIYDPCPKGYIVAPSDFLLTTSKIGKFMVAGASSECALKNYNYYGTFNYGWQFYTDGRGIDNSKIINIPCSGIRFASHGESKIGSLLYPGVKTSIWVSGWWISRPLATKIDREEVYFLDRWSANTGLNIRCVKDNI